MKTSETVFRAFNNIFYERRLKYNSSLNIDQMLVAAYLAENLNPDRIRTMHFGRAVFASFALDHMHDCDSVDELIGCGEYRISFENDINDDPLVTHCLRGIDADISSASKRGYHRDRLRELEPNNTAIMASVLYKDLFRNKNLLDYSSDICDAQDVKGLLFMDYILRTTRLDWVERILDGSGSIECKAVKVARHIRRQEFLTGACVREVDEDPHWEYGGPQIESIFNEMERTGNYSGGQVSRRSSNRVMLSLAGVAAALCIFLGGDNTVSNAESVPEPVVSVCQQANLPVRAEYVRDLSVDQVVQRYNPASIYKPGGSSARYHQSSRIRE